MKTPKDADRIAAVVLAVGPLGAVAWVMLTRGDAVLAGHPAYPVLLGVVAILAIGALLRTVLRRRQSTPTRRRGLVIAARALLAVLTILVVAVLCWLRPFAATAAAREVPTVPGVSRYESATTITLTPAHPRPVGLIFQPGARVDPRAYLPNLQPLAAQGYLVVVIKQPFGIGFTALEAPAAVQREHPDIQRWAVGGHSLGGVVAVQYAESHPQRVQGLLLWASYPSSPMTNSGLQIASVSGTHDGLATPAKIQASHARLPATTRFTAIEGANHAQFGDYGPQPGDGMATIDQQRATEQIAGASLQLMESLSE